MKSWHNRCQEATQAFARQLPATHSQSWMALHAGSAFAVHVGREYSHPQPEIVASAFVIGGPPGVAKLARCSGEPDGPDPGGPPASQAALPAEPEPEPVPGHGS